MLDFSEGSLLSSRVQLIASGCPQPEQVNDWSNVPGDTVFHSGLGSDPIDILLEDVLVRRACGELVTDAQLMAAYPEYLPRLSDELAAIREVHRAYLAAQRAGPSDRTYFALSIEEI